MDKKVLVDFASAIHLTLQESVGPTGKYLVARGEFGRADVATQNRRKYPRKVWEREIQKIQEAIRAGKVLGHIDHPSDGKTSLNRVSHIITSLDMREDGQIIGEAKILDNEYGRQLRSILEAGGAVGVSSRGLGSTMMGEDGMEVVQDDYSYMTHDFVADPAVITSYPKFTTEVRWIEPKSVVVEAKKEDKEMEKDEKSVEMEIEMPAPESLEAPEAEEEPKEEESKEAEVKELQKELEALMKDGKGDSKEAKKLLKDLVKLAMKAGEEKAEEKEEETAEEEKPEQEEKPEAEMEMPAEMPAEEMPPALEAKSPVAALDKALTMEEIKRVLMPHILPEETEKLISEEKAKVKSLTKQVAELTEGVEKLGATCNRLGVALYFERAMKRLPESDQKEVSAIVGDLSRYADVKSVEKSILEAKAVVGNRRLEEANKRKLAEEAAAKAKALEEETNKKLAEMEERNKKLEAQLKESLEQAKALGIRVYLEERVKDNPNAAQIRKLCEGKTSKEEVDAVIKRHAVMPVTSEDYSSVRRRFDKFRNTQLVEEHVKETAPAVAKKREMVSEGVEGEMADLFPGVSLDQVKSLM